MLVFPFLRICIHFRHSQHIFEGFQNQVPFVLTSNPQQPTAHVHQQTYWRLSLFRYRLARVQIKHHHLGWFGPIDEWEDV